ncbi:MAG: hypothetical protein K0U59_05630 [Gammaproteobacteria bacterium]|nr:hypothetical protein [Gammaproteobacteria bacterium]
MINQNEILDGYQKIRRIGTDLNSKYLKFFNAQDMRIAGRALGILKGKKMIFSSEEDMIRYYDFLINDYKDINGKNIIQTYKDKAKDISKEEISIMDASINSSASLYEIVGSDSQRKEIKLKNLLNDKAKNINLLDIKLSSNSLIEELIVYTRVITFPEFNITSGAALLFDNSHRDKILNKYTQKMEKIIIGDKRTQQAAAFFQLYQKYGCQNIAYQ